jgi:hypothetical protein
VATSIFLISFAVGHLFAKANLPDYSKESALVYLAANVQPMMFDGSGTIHLTLWTPLKIYSYTNRGSEVSVTNGSGSKYHRWKMLELERASDFLALGAVPAGGGLFEIITTTVALQRAPLVQRVVLVTGALLTAISGGMFGYYSAYSDPQDYDNPAFADALRDPANWQPIIDRLKGCGLSRGLEPSLANWGSKDSGLELKNNAAECQKLSKWVEVKAPSR